MYQAGETHNLNGVHAQDARGNGTILHGDFELVEFTPREPSAYVWSDEWIVLPVIAKNKDDWENYILFVEAYDLMEKLDPEGFKKMQEELERADKEEYFREINNNTVRNGR